MTGNQSDMEQTTMSMNTKRAAWAQTALEAFQKECGPDDAETSLSDLIGDLLHLAESLDLDPIAVVQRAIGMWHAESLAAGSEPEMVDYDTYATVTIERRPGDVLPRLSIDLALLKAQKQWLLRQPRCDEIEGLLNLIDALFKTRPLTRRPAVTAEDRRF
jgi:hypothetical protein